MERFRALAEEVDPHGALRAVLHDLFAIGDVLQLRNRVRTHPEVKVHRVGLHGVGTHHVVRGPSVADIDEPMSNQLVGNSLIAVLLGDRELGHVPGRFRREVVGQVALLLHLRQEALDRLRRLAQRHRAAEADHLAAVLGEDDATVLVVLVPHGTSLVDGIRLVVRVASEGLPVYLDESVDFECAREERGSVVDLFVVRQRTTSISLSRMTASSVISAEIG